MRKTEKIITERIKRYALVGMLHLAEQGTKRTSPDFWCNVGMPVVSASDTTKAQ